MAKRQRKYPALQQFLDHARQLGYREDQIHQSDDNLSSNRYPYNRTMCVVVKLQGTNGGPRAWFKKDTGAFVKGQSRQGYSMNKTATWADAAKYTDAAVKQQEQAEKDAVAQRTNDHVAKVADAYAEATELERLTFSRAFKIAGDAGITKPQAIEVVLALLDSGALDEIKRAVAARARIGEGYLPGSSYRPSGTWLNGKIVKEV